MYADLCEVAPGNTDCRNWTSICQAPGMSKWALCGAVISCVDDPTQPHCATYQLPSATVDANIADLCDSMPNMPGCSLQTSCKNDTVLQQTSFCTRFAALKTICMDMPKMSGCSNFTSMCLTTGTVVQQCATPILAIPGTYQAATLVKSICTEMYMTACDNCPGPGGPGTGANCDLLGTYNGLCLSMPKMTQVRLLPLPPFASSSSLTFFFLGGVGFV